MRQLRGFTLIELMVAVALGLVTTVIIAQVLLQSEGSKRSTTGGADAQVAGSLALFALQRDLEMAGYGMAGMPDALGCPVVGQYNGTSVSGFQGSSDPLVPVLIGAGASASASDTVSIWSSGKANFSVPIKLTETHDQNGTSFVVASTMGVASGDLLLAVPSPWTGGNCVVMAATSGSVDSDTVITHGNTSPWNSNTSANLPAAGIPAGSALFNLGATPLRRTYSIDTSTWSLQVADFQASSSSRTTRSQFPQIVLLKALYGKATTANGVVTKYESATPTSNDQWQLVRSVRLVIVARSGQYEKEAVTTSSPQWEVGPQVAGMTTTTCRGQASATCVDLDVSASGSTNVLDPKGVSAPAWQHYRYKVFDTVVPLRNMVWMAGPS